MPMSQHLSKESQVTVGAVASQINSSVDFGDIVNESYKKSNIYSSTTF